MHERKIEPAVVIGPDAYRVTLPRFADAPPLPVITITIDKRKVPSEEAIVTLNRRDRSRNEQGSSSIRDDKVKSNYPLNISTPLTVDFLNSRKCFNDDLKGKIIKEVSLVGKYDIQYPDPHKLLWNFIITLALNGVEKIHLPTIPNDQFHNFISAYTTIDLKTYEDYTSGKRTYSKKSQSDGSQLAPRPKPKKRPKPQTAALPLPAPLAPLVAAPLPVIPTPGELIDRYKKNPHGKHFKLPDNREELQSHLQQEGKEYIHDPNTLPLLLANVDAIGQMGVFAAKKIVGPATICKYAGVTGELKGEDRSYAFMLNQNGDGIDALHQRGIGAYINHSSFGKVIPVKKGLTIEFHVPHGVVIEEGEQLTYDYGNEYKHDLKNYRYIHWSDNSHNPYQHFEHFKQLYFPNLTRVLPEIQALYGYNKEDVFLLPKIFHAIYSENIPQLEHDLAEIKAHECLEQMVLIACRVDAQNTRCLCLPSGEQQNITPLMAACVMGNKNIIELLLKHKCDVTRTSLIGGMSGLMFLLCTPNHSKEKKTEIGTLLIQHGADFKIKNAQGKTALDYCVEQDLLELLEVMMKQEVAQDVLASLIENIQKGEKNIFDYCVMNNKMTALGMLLTQPTPRIIRELQNAILSDRLFSNQLLKHSPQEVTTQIVAKLGSIFKHNDGVLIKLAGSQNDCIEYHATIASRVRIRKAPSKKSAPTTRAAGAAQLGIFGNVIKADKDIDSDNPYKKPRWKSKDPGQTKRSRV